MELDYNKIISKAQLLVEKFEHLPEYFSGYDIPEDYNKEGKGGFLAIYTISGCKELLVKIGDIVDKEIPIYKTEELRCKETAVFMCSTINNYECILSEETNTNEKGGVKITEQYVSAFCGKSQLENQAIVILGFYLSEYISREKFEYFRTKTNNPYLKEIFLEYFYREDYSIAC